MSDNPTYWQWRDEQYRAKLAACQETDHAFQTYHWTDPESAIRAVYARVVGAPAPDSWSDALAAIARIAPATESDPTALFEAVRRLEEAFERESRRHYELAAQDTTHASAYAYGGEVWASARNDIRTMLRTVRPSTASSGAPPHDPVDRVAPLGEPGPAVLPDEEGM